MARVTGMVAGAADRGLPDSWRPHGHQFVERRKEGGSISGPCERFFRFTIILRRLEESRLHSSLLLCCSVGFIRNFWFISLAGDAAMATQAGGGWRGMYFSSSAAPNND